MRRSLFIALGIMAMIVGLESMLIDSANFYSLRGSTPTEFIDPSSIPGQSIVSWAPAEWFPWAGLAGGALLIIYTFTLPKRIHAFATAE